MGDTQGLEPDILRSRRLLAASVALSWIGVLASSSLGSVIVLRLTGDAALSGLPFVIVALGSAITAVPAGHLMDRYGRIPVLAFGHVIGALGFLVGLYGIQTGDFVIFLAGNAVASIAAGATYLTRLAAADLHPKSQRARGVAMVVFAAVIGAIIGTTLLASFDYAPEDAPSAEALAWSLGAASSLAAAFIVSLIRVDPKNIAAQISATEPTPPPRRSDIQGIHWRPLLAAAVALMAAQGAMVAVMSVAGASLDLHHHSRGFISLTMTGHIVGMFLPSLVAGRIGDRFGRRPLLILSSVILATAAFSVTQVEIGIPFSIALFVIGVGWSFAFVGATAAVADHAPLAWRARALGWVDFATAGTGSAGALAAGFALDQGNLPFGNVPYVGWLALGFAVIVMAAAWAAAD